jgi:hypothetical protein
MVHRAFGRVPLVDEAGPDLTRSAAGRLAGEMIWTPAVALDPAVAWKPVDDDTATAVVACAGETCEVSLTVAADGSLRTVAMPRWASVARGAYRLHRFGAEIHAEATFGGFTVPGRLTAGYDDGAFITINVDAAVHR